MKTSTAKQVLGNCDCTRPGADWRWTGYGRRCEREVRWSGEEMPPPGGCWACAGACTGSALPGCSTDTQWPRAHTAFTLKTVCKLYNEVVVWIRALEIIELWRASWRAWWRCWWGQRAWTSWRMRSRQSRRILTKTLLLTKPCVVFNNKIVVCWGNLESTVGAKLTVLCVLGHYHIRGGQRLYFPPSLRGQPSTPFGVQWGIFADNQMRIWMGSDDLI